MRRRWTANLLCGRVCHLMPKCRVGQPVVGSASRLVLGLCIVSVGNIHRSHQVPETTLPAATLSPGLQPAPSNAFVWIKQTSRLVAWQRHCSYLDNVKTTKINPRSAMSY